MEHALKTGMDNSIDVNSWLKLQYLPKFGGDLWKQVRALGRGSMPFLFRMNYHVIYQIEKGEYIMFNFGLLEEQAEGLMEKWEALGATSSVTSGPELLEALGESQSSLHDELGSPLGSLFRDSELPCCLSTEELQHFRDSYQDWRTGAATPSSRRGTRTTTPKQSPFHN